MIVPKAFSWFLAVRYLRTRWVNLIGMLGIALAVWAMIVVIAVFSGFINEARKGIDDASPDLLLTGLRPGTDYFVVQPIIEAVDGVVNTSPRVTHIGMVAPHGGLQLAQHTASIPSANTTANRGAVMLLGIDPAMESATTNLLSWLSKDRIEKRLPGSHPIIKPADYVVDDPKTPFEVSAKKIYRTDRMLTRDPELKLGSQIGVLLGSLRLTYGDEILPGQRLDIVSAWHEPASDNFQKILFSTYLSGAFHTGHRMFDFSVCMLPIDQLRVLLGEGEERELVTDVAIKITPGGDIRAIAKAVEAAVKDTCGGEALDFEQQNETYLGAVDQERAMMKLVLFAVMLVAAFLIFATLHMMVAQKVKDIGILTSLGATPNGIGAIFVLGGLVVGAVGCGIGTLTGCISVWSLNYVNDLVYEYTGQELFPIKIYSLDRVPTDLDPAWMVQVVGGALLLSIIVSWLPARRAARLDPVKALMRD